MARYQEQVTSPLYVSLEPSPGYQLRGVRLPRRVPAPDDPYRRA